MSARLFRLDPLSDHAAPPPDPPAAPREDAAVLVQAARDEGYARGFTEGASRAAQAARDQSRALDATLAEALSDRRFELAAIRAAAEGEMLALLHAVVETVLSARAARDLGPRLAELIREELARCPDAHLRVHLSPQDAALIAADLPEGIDVQADPAQATGTARVATDTGLAELDSAALVARVLALLTPPIPSPSKEEPSHEHQQHG